MNVNLMYVAVAIFAYFLFFHKPKGSSNPFAGFGAAWDVIGREGFEKRLFQRAEENGAERRTNDFIQALNEKKP